METKEKYLQFPLFLIRNMVIDKETTINKILNFGIYKYSKNFDYSIEDASKNLVYYYCRKQNDLTKYLLKAINRYSCVEILDLDEDCSGFQGKEFEPAYEIEQLIEIFKTDTEFKNEVIEFYQMQLSYNSLGISGNIEMSLKQGKEIESQIEKNEPLPMINMKLLFEFRDKEKSEFDLMQFVAFVGIKSIIGKKQYVKTNKNHIISRMFGYSSIMQLPNEDNAIIKELIKKYSYRYHIDRVLLYLELNWKLMTYSNNIRGMYLSIENKINIDELALIAETKKHKNKIKALQQLKIDAKEKALKQLKKKFK